MSDTPDNYLHFAIDLNASETVAAYDELPLWSATFGLLLLKYIPLRQGMTVLDVGCGTGFPLLELAQRLGTTSMVYGIDPWENAIKRANLKADLWNVRNIDIRQGDAAAMPFTSGLFDLIVANLGINNFSNPQTVLTECWRVSQPSARIALTTNLQGHFQEFYDVFEATLLNYSNEQAVNALKSHIKQRATIAGIRTLFEQTGFRVSKVHEESSTMRFIDGSALLRHYFIKLGFLDSWKSVIDPEQQVSVFARLEAALNDLAKEHGELTLTIPMAYIEGEKIP